MPTAMHLLRLPALLLLLFALQSPARSQPIPTGTWRTHLSYQQAGALAANQITLLCGTDNGLFEVRLSDLRARPLSTTEGLSDAGVSALAWWPAGRQWIIGYQSGNIDLLSDDEIINFRTLLNLPEPGSKRIADILLIGPTAYLATPLGIVAFEPGRPRIRETYREIGPNGQRVPVSTLALLRTDTLLALTTAGVLAAPLAPSVNRQDFRNWRRMDVGIGAEVRAVATEDGAIWMATDNRGVWLRERSGRFSRLALPENGPFLFMRNTGSGVLLGLPGGALYRLLPDGGFVRLTATLTAMPVSALSTDGGRLWIADRQNGLILFRQGEEQTLSPSGPLAATPFRMYYAQNRIFALSGGFERGVPARLPGQLSVFDEQTGWTNFSAPPIGPNAQPLPSITDLSAIAALPDGRLLLGSFGRGLLEGRLSDGQVQIGGAVSDPAFRPDTQGNFNVSALAPAPTGECWVALFNSSPTYYRLSSGGPTLGLQFALANSSRPVALLSDRYGQQWAALDPTTGGGLLVFKDAVNARRLTAAAGNGGLPSANVFSVAEDLEGNIWVGTDNGVAVIVNNGNMTAPAAPDAIRPRVEGAPLLSGETVRAIAVDGGNRKWIGTENGLWLFSPEGERPLAQFTTRNSPLLSDRIRNVSINALSGEVFIGTEGGLISYRSDASEGRTDFGGLRAFPNPVTPEFQGVVTIDGLMQNSWVRITDAGGRLVWATRANGGTATWDLRTPQQRRVQSGIYYILCTDATGQTVGATRLAVLSP